MSELDDENDYTLVFDHFYTNNHIQILKSLLPFFGTGASSYLPILIKYLEERDLDVYFFVLHQPTLVKLVIWLQMLVILLVMNYMMQSKENGF